MSFHTAHGRADLRIVIRKYSFGDGAKLDVHEAGTGSLCERLVKSLQLLSEVNLIGVGAEDADLGWTGLRGGGAHDWYEIVKFSVPVVLAAGAYAGKKALDVVGDIVKLEVTKNFQEKHGNVAEVEIYGPDGTVIKKIKVTNGR